MTTTPTIIRMVNAAALCRVDVEGMGDFADEVVASMDRACRKARRVRTSDPTRVIEPTIPAWVEVPEGCEYRAWEAETRPSHATR